MFKHPCRSSLLALSALIFLGLSACGTVNETLSSTGATVSQAVSPYKIDVVQGNVVTREQVALLQVGMPRAQVRDVLGSALLSSLFHADRWDYVFTLKRQRAEPQSRKVTVFFKDNLLERIESDELPSEQEFVATLRTPVQLGKVPPMEASAEKLKKFPVKSKPAPEPAPVVGEEVIYPPLEPIGK
jgi:outer membrane protein assembly factor BamE